MSKAKRILAAAAAAGLVGAGSQPARAATNTWVGGNATAPHWDQTANWDLGAKPTATDDVVFPTPIPATPGATISLGAGELANSLTFNDTYTLGTAAGAGDLTLTTSGVTVATGKTATIASQLKGTAGITLTGGGTLALTNTTTATTNNTFTGGINVNAGTLSYSADAALGAVGSGNSITLNGGTLTYTGAAYTNARTINVGASGGTFNLSANVKITNSTAGQFTGSGTITRAGTANNTANNFSITNVANTGFTGTWNLTGGVTEAQNANALGANTASVIINSGAELAVSSLTVQHPITINGGTIGGDNGNATNFAGPVTVNGAFTVRLGDFHNATSPRNLTISGNISGTGAFTFAGSAGAATAAAGQTLFLTGNNAGYNSAVIVAAGFNVAFGQAASIPTAGVTINSTTAALGGIGVAFDAVPTFTNTRNASPGGVFGINTATFATALDQSTGQLAGMWIGSQGTGTYTAATLTPDGTTYRLGGGQGTLTIANPVLTGANDLAVGDARINGGGTVVLGTLANTFSGTVTVSQGSVSVADVTNGGANGPLGSGSTAIALGSATTNGGLTYTGAASDSTDRAITLGAGGGTITVSTAAATLTVGQVGGTGTLVKAGAGVLTLPGPANSMGGANVSAGTLNVNGTTSNAIGAVTLASGATLNLNNVSPTATTLTTTAGTINANVNVTFTGAAAISAAGGTTTLNTAAATAATFNGAFTIGSAATSGSLTLGTDASFVMNAAGSNFVIGNRTTANANIINDTFNASAARNVSISAATVQVGFAAGSTAAPENSNATEPLVRFTLPTGATSTATITAATQLAVGVGENTGNDTLSTAAFNLGGGTNTITTPAVTLGGPKRGADFRFAAGSAGSLALSAAAGGKTNVTIGTNLGAGTGTRPLSTMNLTTTGTVSATLGTVTMATANITGTSAGGAQAAFTLAAGGPGSVVTADTVTIGTLTGGTTGATLFAATFNVSAGTFRFNSGGTGFVAGTATGTLGSRTSTINVSGTGVLDMNRVALNAVSGGTGTSTLSVTGGVLASAASIGNFTNLTFSGGTIRDAGSIARAVAQTGAGSRLEVTSAAAGAGTSIAGNYSLASGAASVTAGKTLSVAGNLSLDPTAGGTLGVDLSGTASGLYALTGTAQLGLTSTTSDTLSLTALTPITTETTYTVATFAGYAAGDADFESVLVNGSPAQSANPGGANYVTVAYNPTNIQITVNNVAAVPEPGTAGVAAIAAAGLLAARRRRRSR